MENKIHEIDIYSGQVRDFLSKPPRWLIRGGTTIVFFAVVTLLCLSMLIKYPEVVRTHATLTTLNAPKPIIPKIQSKLTNLLIANGSYVKEGDVIGVLETTANADEVLQLEAHLNRIDSCINTSGYNSLLQGAIATIPNKNLGELQADYQNFIKAYLTFSNYMENGVFIKKLTLLHNDILRLNRSIHLLRQQKKLTEKDIGLTQATYDANEKLVRDRVISRQEYRDITSQLIGKQMDIPKIETSIIINETEKNNTQKEILELENMIGTQRDIFHEELNTLKSQIADWKQKYLLSAPTEGKLNFTSVLQENQQVIAYKPIAFVVPENTVYFMQAAIPQNNFGKVKKGQKVLIKFFAYQWQEYGTVEGRITDIAAVAIDSSGYMARIELPNGLRTSRGEYIQYREGLVANAEIVTKDQRLLTRFYFSIVKSTNS